MATIYPGGAHAVSRLGRGWISRKHRNYVLKSRVAASGQETCEETYISKMFRLRK